MAAAPWCPRHTLAAAPDFLGAAAVPVPRGPSLFLRAADGGFTRSHRHLLSLPKAPRFARVGSEPRPPAGRSCTGTSFAEGVGSDERRGGGRVTRRSRGS